ncbi:uncharacterized protein GGS25DRAFT_490599 [Hypoxylon fragiforme]|uniref:uncharacterized protein n=1 Tax=Hypoxylon fragiforme TaxID=63214 RepID=UPI0020C64226|nr:uncharacterized protein GGS25DRAFT_490599 [Hypoxylon fragiforme]KAI2608513.1 hypothetical protein GGS25DRAFT_490599 [Hypoxylon fragiforme]
MAPSVDHRHVNLARSSLAPPETFTPHLPEHDRHHDVYRYSTESSCQASIMSTEDTPLDLSRTLTAGSEGWTDLEDKISNSSITSDTSHARISRRPHFPPVLPSVNSSSSLSKSLPQKLAATISAIEGPSLARGQPKTSKSQSPSTRARRMKSLAPQTQKPLIYNEFRENYPSSGLHNSSNHPYGLLSWPARPIPRGIQETILGQSSPTRNGDLKPTPYVLESLELDSDISDDEEVETGTGSFDSEEDDDEDSSSDHISRSLRRLAQNYSRLRDRRTDLWEIFDGIRLKRAHVEDSRHDKDEASLAFMAAVQAILPGNPTLDKLFKNMQNAQLKCQEAEQRFDDMLDELEQGEVELELEEQKFYTAAADIDSQASDDGFDNESSSQTSENSALRGITGDRPEDIHPLFEELREASRNLQLAKELLVNTQMKRKALSAGKSQLLAPDSIELLEKYGEAGRKRALELKRLGVMSEDDLEELQDYDDLEQTALYDIDRFTSEAARLEIECREKEVMPKNTPFQQEGFGFNPVNRDEIYLEDVPLDSPLSRECPKTLAHPTFPRLLHNPTHLLENFPITAQQSLRIAVSLPPEMPLRQKHIDDAAREVNIQSLHEEAGKGDKTGYINRWLLHKLHVSPMEAEILWSTFHVHLKVLNVDKWQQDVLHAWWKDQAARLPSAQFDGAYEDGSLASSINPRTDLPSRRYSDSGQLDHIRLWDVEEAWP